MNKQENKGITLVALVITIIVLIILAGVSINAVMNGGLITNAKDAKNEYEKAKAEESTELGRLEQEIKDSKTAKDFETQKTQGYTNNVEDVPEYTPYLLKNGYITGVTLQETVAQFEQKLPVGYEVEADSDTDIVTTGMLVKKDGKTVAEIVVYGDLTETTSCNPTAQDASFILAALGDSTTVLSNIDIVASDVNHDNVLNWKDIQYIQFQSSKPVALTQFHIIAQNAYASNASSIINESYEKSKQKYVNNLADTIKTKFTWQDQDAESDAEGYYLYTTSAKNAEGESITVGDILQNMPGAVIANGTTVLAEGDAVEEGYKIMLTPGFVTSSTTYMLELGTIQIEE